MQDRVSTPVENTMVLMKGDEYLSKQSETCLFFGRDISMAVTGPTREKIIDQVRAVALKGRQDVQAIMAGTELYHAVVSVRDGQPEIHSGGKVKTMVDYVFSIGDGFVAAAADLVPVRSPIRAVGVSLSVVPETARTRLVRLVPVVA